MTSMMDYGNTHHTDSELYTMSEITILIFRYQSIKTSLIDTLCLFSEVGQKAQPDIEQIPEATVKPSFTTVKDVTPQNCNIFIFDLETTSLSKCCSFEGRHICRK